MDCSLPMTFDTYSLCSYNCLYCFSYNQKGFRADYLGRRVKSIDPAKVMDMFNRALNNQENEDEYYSQFTNYIRERYTFQWGGLADPFDEYERAYGIGLGLLEFFDDIDYPISFSTKGSWFIGDKRYTSIITRHSHNWHYKVSIITLDEFKARAVERGVPSPSERLRVIETLAGAGLHVTLRLRPYIIGVSDDYIELIERAREAGADSVSLEFLCLEGRATEKLRKRYQGISDIIGRDVMAFYRQYSRWTGYMRLNYELKRPIVRNIEQLCQNLGMRLYISDAHHKERSHNCCCCGLPDQYKFYRGNLSQALQIAKLRGEVRLSDIFQEAERVLNGVPVVGASGFNPMSAQGYMCNTMLDYIRTRWNTPNSAASPYRYTDGILVPAGLDESGDVIYRFNRVKNGGRGAGTSTRA